MAGYYSRVSQLGEPLVAGEGSPTPRAERSGRGGPLGSTGSTDSDASFTRKSTFGWPMGFTRELTFTRGLTGVLGIDWNVDEAWTKQLIDSYVYGEENGRDGDVPLPAAFAQDGGFWKTMLVSGLIGCFMGLAGVGFMNVVDYVPTLWIDNGGFDQASDCDFYAGKLYWLCVPMLAGMVIGLIRHFASYPDNLPGLFKEILNHHVDPKWAPLTFLISAISLGGGASLGPEQALGNLAGGLATYLAESPLAASLNLISCQSDDQKLLVLSGMAAAMGALFPSPMLGVMMIHELGNPPKGYMEGVIVMSAGAISAFLVYYALLGDTKVAYFSANFIATYNWEFEEWQCGTAIVIGMVSAALALTTAIFVGATKQIFVRLRMRLGERSALLKAVLPPMIGGLLVGTINYCLPLTVGDGNLVIKQIIQYGHNYVTPPSTPPPTLQPLFPAVNTDNSISTSLLVSSLFAKMFVLGVSINSGFVGGFVFPTILIGIMAGVVCYQLFPDTIPLGMCISCFLAAVPAGICPMPFTLACLAMVTQYNGLYQTVPIYLATITSYTLVCGSGIFTALQRRGMAQQAALLQRQQEAQQAKQKEDDAAFAIEQYQKAMSRAAQRVPLPDSP